jgi:dTDP-glucose 4,6-dehydratase
MQVDDGRVVPNFLKQAICKEPLTVYGDGSQTRSFCYVDDLIEGIYRLLLSDEHDPVNIGNPTETTILEFAETINALTENKSGIIFKPELRIESDPQRRQPDISRARRILGWEAKICLDDGIRRTLPYFQQEIALG